MNRQPKTLLREKYNFLEFLYNMEKFVMQGKEEIYKEEIIKAKREIRKIHNKDNKLRAENQNKHIVKDYGMNGWIEKEIFTNTTAEKVTAYAEENWMECKPSIYDCTGQLFTSWFEVFEVEDKIILYTEYSFDF